MNNNNGSIDFEAYLRLEKLEEGVKEMEKMLNDSMKSSQKETDKLQQSINNLAKGAMAFFTLSQAKTFVSQVIEVRSQFQQLEISFGTMLKSKEKANALMAQMADLAAKTPFGLEEVSEEAKRLLAFQVPAEEVTETLRRMGDVASGLGVPMGQLIHVYGQVKAQGKLMTNDLYQFMNAGIPIIAELSKVVGKSETEIKDMVSAGKIGFPEVQAVIKNMTNEGGLFFNLMAEQSKSLGGQISNLGDSFNQMLNEIGKATEGIASGAISSVSFLVENYQTLGKVIAGLIATYGTYRTAVLVNIALTKGWSIATKEDAIAKGIQTAATKAQTIATAALNTVMKANPYVLVATAVVALGFAMWALKDNTDANTRATERHNKLREEQANLIDDEKNRISGLISTIQDETKSWNERNKAFLALRNSTDGVLNKYSTLNQMLREMSQVLKDINGRYETMNEKMSRDAVKKTNDLIKSKEEQIKKLEEEIKQTASSDHRTALRTDIANIRRSIEQDELLKQKQKREVVKNDVSNYESSLSGRSLEQIQAEKKLINEAYNLRKKQAKEAVSNLSISKIDSNNPYLKYDWEELGMYNEATERQIKLKQQEKKQIHDKNELLKEQSELQVKIKNLQGKTIKDDNELAQIDSWQKRHDEVSKILESKFGAKKETSKTQSKSERPTFDQEAHLLQTQRITIDNELAEQKKGIDALKDGYDKELALIHYFYDEKAEAIRRGGEDARIALEKERTNSKGLMSNETYNARLNAINENEIIANEQNSALKIQQEQKLLDGLLEKYQTYTDQRKAIEEKYNADIAALQAKLGADAPQVKKAQDEKARELKKLDILYKKEGTAIAKLFENMRKKTVKEIRQTIADAEKEIDALAKVLNMDDNANVEFITNLRQQLEQARDTADRSDTVFGRLGKNIQAIFKFKPNTIEWKEALQGVLSDAQSITGEFGQLGQEFEKLGQSTGNDTLKRIGQTMQTVSNTLNRTLSMTQAGAQMGGGIGAAIGAVVGLITSGFEMYFKNELEAEKKRYEIAKSKIAQQNEYNRLLFEEKMLHKENISVFGKKELAIANDNLKEYINQRGELKKRISENLYSNKAITVANGTYSTGWGIFEKEGTVWDNLIDVFPQLINKAGEFDAKVAKSIIDSKELYGDGKERLKGLIEQYERAQEAQKQFDEYVKNTFGELGTSVIDSVYNALQKGEDAFESFAKSVGNVIGKLGKQLAYELFIADHFKRLQEKITQAGKNNNGSEDFARQSSQIVSEFGNAMKSKVSEMQTFLKQWNEMGKANGFEFLNEQNRQATEKGFARMSQDTGEELNGQFRLQTQLSAEIKNAMLQSVKEFAEMHKFMQTSSAQQLRHLAGIEANTFQLHEMKKDIANMKAGISEITTKGIKIRS